MIHIIEIDVPNRSHFGSTITSEIILPSKIRKINGVLANVKNGKDSDLESLVTYGIERKQVYFGNLLTTSIGVCSLAVNNTGVLISQIPLLVTSELANSSLKRNMMLIDGGVLVRTGSMLRVVIEEKQKNPFITTKKIEETAEMLADTYPTLTKDEAMRLLNIHYGSIHTNDYKVKIYIDYDK